MTNSSSTLPSTRNRTPLRVWPGVIAVAALVLVRFVLPLSGGTAILGAAAGAVAVLAWWLLASRARWVEKLGALAFMAVALTVTIKVVHPSIANGMMGMMPVLFAIPFFCLALVVWAAIAGRFSPAGRLLALALTIAVACSSLTLVRTDGVTGDADSQLHWRWTPTPEERLLAQTRGQVVPAVVPAESSPAASTAPSSTTTAGDQPVAGESAAGQPAAAEAAAAPARGVGTAPESGSAPGSTPPDEATAKLPAADSGTTVHRAAAATTARPEWPGFRGPQHDGTVRATHLATNWSQSPPRQLWRRNIGPGWSSFAVASGRLYTQEQRGEDELVSCYDLLTGAPVWQHRDPVRFWESNAGAGPRGTPTVDDGRVYAVGATGLVKALDAASGRVIWTRDAGEDTETRVPDWGFSSSPLVVDDLVLVAASNRLIAYDSRTGEPRWQRRAQGGSYSSPQLFTLGGRPQVLLVGGSSTLSVDPTDGTVLWEHEWAVGAGIVQPAVTADGDVLIAPGDAMGGAGIRRVAVTKADAGWSTGERWTSRGLKPYFNDFVVHEGHAYGFDGSILASIDLTTGERDWKGGRYGHGQLLLLPDQRLLLVLSEEGELALVGADPSGYREIARIPGIEGKTWNHPVLVGDLLLVRNGETMAAFRLPRTGGEGSAPQ